MSTTSKTYGTASASSFWAQKSREVKALPAPIVAEPYETTKPTAEAKDRMVFKSKLPIPAVATITDCSTGMTNDAAATYASKKTDWADNDDDDESVATFSTKNLRISANIEDKITEKDPRDEELNAAVAIQDARIRLLEEDVEAKAQTIVSLEVDAEDKGIVVEQLKDENHKQYLYVQELVAEVDVHIRRITELESDLDAKCAHIRELEMKFDLQTHISTCDPMTVEAEQNEPDTCNTGEVLETAPQISSRTTSIKDTLVPTYPRSEVTAVDAHEPPIAGALVRNVPVVPVGPAVNDSKYPKLWSPDMSKKLAPVEKPKVLKMAIDTSKFKKPVPFGTKSASVANTGFIPNIHGLSSRHRTKTEAVPNIDFNRDIRYMVHAERVLFANGPKVIVALGTTKLATLPKYILMQCSEKANKHFTDNPNATLITFPDGCMDVDAAKAHLQWMDEMTYQGRVYSLALHTDEKFDTKNLKICQAARVMGLNNIYVGHFTKILCDRVRNNNSSVEFISLICELAYHENDPIFECVANNLVNQRLSHPFKDYDTLDKLVVKYPFLEEKMMKIEQRIKDARTSEKRKVGQLRQGTKDRNGGIA